MFLGYHSPTFRCRHWGGVGKERNDAGIRLETGSGRGVCGGLRRGGCRGRPLRSPPTGRAPTTTRRANRYSPLDQITAAERRDAAAGVELSPQARRLYRPAARRRSDSARDRQHDVSRVALRRDPRARRHHRRRRSGNFSFPTTTCRRSAASPTGRATAASRRRSSSADCRAGCTRIKASDGTLNAGFGENGVVNLKTPEVMQTGMDVGLLAAVVADHLQEPDHHRRGHRRRAGRLECRNRTRRRHARVGRANRQAGVDLPHRAAAGRVRLRHLGREQREESIRRQRVGLHVARCGARHSLHAARRAEQRPRRRRSSRQQSLLLVGGRGRCEHRQVPVALPARASRHLGLRHAVGAAARRSAAATARRFPPSSSSTRPA